MLNPAKTLVPVNQFKDVNSSSSGAPLSRRSWAKQEEDSIRLLEEEEEEEEEKEDEEMPVEEVETEDEEKAV